jgi:hypothetical protein
VDVKCSTAVRRPCCLRPPLLLLFHLRPARSAASATWHGEAFPNVKEGEKPKPNYFVMRSQLTQTTAELQADAPTARPSLPLPAALGRRHWTKLPLLPCSSSKCHSRCAHEWSRASLSRRHLRRYTNLCVAVNSWLPALFVGFRLDIRTSINHFPSAEIFFTKVKERRVIICLVLIDIASVDYSLSFST